MLIESHTGIRGIFGKDLDLSVVRKYALAFYNFLKEKQEDKERPLTIVIGSDTRNSSEEIKREFIKTLSSLNSKVLDLGYNTTPIVQHAVKTFSADGGIIVTASHNPKEYNGFKFLSNEGSQLIKEEMKELITLSKTTEEKFFQGDFRNVKNAHKEAIDSYIDFLINFIGQESIKKIKEFNPTFLLDPNGGAACFVIKKLFKKLGIKILLKNNNPGIFNREIEPNESSLNYLKDIIIKTNIDFAAGFDCDADRIIFVTRDEVVPGHKIFALISSYILEKQKHPELCYVVANDATSYLVKKIIEKYKAKYIEVETGETNIVAKMKELQAILGGEGLTGGVIFKNTTSRDGLLTLLFILKIMAEKNKRLNDLIKQLPSYSSLAKKVQLKQEQTSNLLLNLKNYFLNNNFKISEKGSALKVFFGEDWLWFRASSTEKGLLRILADSRVRENAERLLKEGEFLIKKLKDKE